VLICECTYGDRDHPPRIKVEQDFLAKVHSIIDSGQSVLIPVFALGRSQEILLLLAQERLTVPIYFDGMSNETSDIIISNPSSVKDVKALEKALKKAVRVKKMSERMDAVHGQSIIITTSGMLTGGPILFYLKQVADRADFKVLLTGYQVEGTNGRSLLDRKEINIEGAVRRVAGDVMQFDFSAHDGMSELKALIRKISPKKIIFVHGDESAILKMKEWADALDIECFAPKLGEYIDV
jgi:putative mRNA 3-end processing factor